MQRVPTKSMAEAVALFVKEYHLEDGILRSRVYGAWDRVTGSPGLTSSKFYKDRILTCRMSSSVVRQQLRCNLEACRIEINKMLGGEYVDKIILR